MEQHGHHHDAEHHREHAHRGHGHTHGVVDPSIATTDRGLWALKWSFVGLMVTAAIQVVVVVLSGSVGLLADTIHNFADAATAIPLGIAFWLARRGRSRRFTYGLGRVEDFAGILIILTILASALVAGYESITRLIHPEPVGLLWAVMVASVVGFAGNEAVAVFRIRVGKQISSAALIADGYHARGLRWRGRRVGRLPAGRSHRGARDLSGDLGDRLAVGAIHPAADAGRCGVGDPGRDRSRRRARRPGRGGHRRAGAVDRPPAARGRERHGAGRLVGGGGP